MAFVKLERNFGLEDFIVMAENHITRWMDEEDLQIRQPRKPPKKVYIRFGKFSKRDRSINFATGEYERGLSVYNARLETDGSVSLIVNDENLVWTAEDCADRLEGRLAFVVTGKEVGRGSDSEPLLRGVRLLPYAIRMESLAALLKHAD